MRFSINSIKILVASVGCAIVVCLAWGVPVGGSRVAAQSAGDLSTEEQRGRQIYTKGLDEARGEIIAVLGASELDLPASSLPCANCHGLSGEGTREGGIQPPPLTWATLTAAQTSALTGRRRNPYIEATLTYAITNGVDPSGTPLHAAMPRYRMKPAQMADLLAYLKKLGREAVPGLRDDAIKVGAALPVSGPLAQIGEDIKATLEAYFAEVNAGGGIYGRRFELVVEDSRGEPTATLEATRRLVEQHGVFTLVASFEPRGSDAANDYLRQREVPLVGPVTLSPRLTVPPNSYVFYLLPTFSDQARSLVDFLDAKLNAKDASPSSVSNNREDTPAQKATPRLAVIYANSEFDLDALAGLRLQAKLHSMEIVAEHAYDAGRFSASSMAEALAPQKPDYIFFFGGADDIASFAREMERLKLKAALLTSVVMIGRGAFDLPAGVAAKTYMSYPATLPSRNDFAEFARVMNKSKVNLRSSAFQAVAYAAAMALVEGIKTSHRDLSRATFIKSLEQLHDFKTSVVPPLTFGPNRRVGVLGSHIVGLDLQNKQYVPLTDRLEPKRSP